jgi:hypothetical protein
MVLSTAAAFAVNEVTVETKTILGGTSGAIGIFVTNDVAIKQFVCPLKLYTTGGSFITSLGVTVNTAGRFTTPTARLNDLLIYNGYQTQDGVCLTTLPNVGFGTIWPGPDGIPGTYDEEIDSPNPPMPVSASPVGLLIARATVVQMDLPPGSDGATPSFFINVGLTADSGGSFEIDTTCADPAAHVLFAAATGAPALRVPTFQKGIITLIPCDCSHQGDINGDGVIDVFDVIDVIEIAFTDGTDPHDPDCPQTRGDVDNNGVADVFDVVYIIRTAFFGGASPVDPCGP